MSKVITATGPSLAATVSSRIPWTLSAPGERPSVREWAMLVFLGCVAALGQAVVKLHLGISGHAIVLAVLPMAFGTAVVRRPWAGTAMSASALASAMFLAGLGLGRAVGPGALASLATVGVAFDLWFAVWRTRYRIHLAWVCAGVTANLFAFGARAVARTTGLWPGRGMGALRDVSLSHVVLSYLICGLVAGLVSAWICFAPWRTPTEDADGNNADRPR